VILTLRVEERARVRRVEFSGLENLSERAVRDFHRVPHGEPYSPDRMIRARRYIQDELAGKGIPFARVEVAERPVPDREGEIDLVLEVTEGHRVAIAQVEFQGNDAFSDSELRKAMSTRPEGFWWFRTGQFLEASLEEDLREGLPNFYASNGYPGLPGPLRHPPHRSGDGEGTPGDRRGGGPPVPGRRLRGGGNRRFPTPQLEQYYAAEEGGLLRALGIGRDRQEGPRSSTSPPSRTPPGGWESSTGTRATSTPR
jgi:outer membrane protein insertion porin family